MSPFGFTPAEDSNENSPDLAALFAALQSQLQSQFGEELPEDLQKDLQAEFAKMGVNPLGFLNSLQGGLNQGALPQNVARDIAQKFVEAGGEVATSQPERALIEEAMDLADLWLNQATIFPAHSNEKNIYSRSQWIAATMNGWQITVEPLAAGLAEAMGSIVTQDQLPQGAPEIGPVVGILRTFIGTLIATQLGQCIGSLANSVTGAHDVGLPLMDPARPGLLPQNIALWGADIGVDESEVRIFHALREGAIARLFDNNPWLIIYMRSAITDYGKGIRIDLELIQRQAEEAMESGAIDPNNPETFSVALSKGLFTPDESPAQVAAVAKLETALALIDGWADDVTVIAADGRVPSLPALRETLRRRRVKSSPVQQLFSSLLGLEISPRASREASAFWLELRELRDIARRDQIWSGILPTHSELLDVAGYLQSFEVPVDLSGISLE